MSPFFKGKAPALIWTGLSLFLLLMLWNVAFARRRGALPPTGSGTLRSIESAPAKGRAMWVWDARVAVDSTARSQLLRFCRSHHIDTLYLSAYDLRSPMNEHYRAFNRLAHQAGIQVHALAGDPRWGKPIYHHIPLEWTESILRLNAGSPEEERFDGLHTDVEVYLLSKSWKEHPEVLLGGYLDLNAKLAARLRVEESPPMFGVDIPFWFDDDSSYRISWNGQVKLPAQHVLDTVDQVTVMAYRNFAEGSDGTLYLVSLEMKYADPIGKKIVIGQETQENLYPPYVTFGGTSCQVLNQELHKMEKVLARRPSFGGFALHHYESYKKLCGDS